MKQANKTLPIKFSNLFNKQLAQAPLAIMHATREAIEIFQVEPHNDSLRNHSLDELGKKFFGIWSIDISEDWRALYRKKGAKIIFITLGTHNQLYG